MAWADGLREAEVEPSLYAADFARLGEQIEQLLAAELDLERDRMQGWGLVHALHWGVGPKKIDSDLVECARLLAA